MRKIKVVVLLVQQLQHGFTKNAKVSPNLTVAHIPYSRCQILQPSLVFLIRASYGRRRNDDVTSQEREVTMMLRHDIRTDEQMCGKFASQASLFVHHGRGVNRVYIRLLLMYLVCDITLCSSCTFSRHVYGR